jgi:transcriptional regulator with XRE-family HTH domain
MADHGERLSLAVASVVKDRRLKRGWSLERLAVESGMHRTSLGLVERGARGLSVAAAGRLAQALDMRLSEVLREAEASLAET